ncbi:hypothetical protein C8F04DRAFT_1067585 [Mycena alexandri]|uniref:RNA polymerase II-associated protein 1 C-terminal domain-containing protein n=1 Tax=Mycena alexandri TaxID=1745969 RepID=A0AAD6XE79_9AGAR|nr:hypothetical protein C8F04DRAFT_1067585 [Mycena alexandri]
MAPSLVGAVFERPSTSALAPGASTSTFTQSSFKTGFPQAQHRSQNKKSAFARAREAKAAGRADEPPVVVPSNPVPPTVGPSTPPHVVAEPSPPDDWRAQISRENEARVGAMTEEEREEERREILERFGPGIGDVLKKVRRARAAAPSLEVSNSASTPVSPSTTRPSSRAERKLRFAEVTPSDVHVYESAPPSPRKKALALPPPDASDTEVVSLGQYSGKVADEEPDEGTPEYIRRRFFPSAPAHNPDLAWMDDTLVPSAFASLPPSSTLRFDLSGTPLAAPLHASLPTHLGLHHHAPDADGVQRAGYTLDDVFMMSRSGVRAQRAAGLRMVAGVARWVGAVQRGDADLDGALKVAEISELKGRVVAAGIDALAERGALGVHAVEVVWECVVGWALGEEALDVDIESAMDGVELGVPDAAFPLAHLLPQTVAALQTQAESPDSSSRTRILAILHRLARQTNEIATEIVGTPNLISALFRTFLLNASADASALDLLITLASSTRANAQTLAEPADALLRFVTTLPPPDPALLIGTLTFYAVLASYGLYAHIAGTAHILLAALAEYVLESAVTDRKLSCAWAGLLEVWIVCAVDPHRTTPEHEIIWSQVAAWGWAADVLALRGSLGVLQEDWGTWAALWRAEAAWVEGARVNGVRAGEADRAKCVEAVKAGFEVKDGKEHLVVAGAIAAFAQDLNEIGRGGAAKLKRLGRSAEALMAAIRLWLACLPPAADGPLSAPPFSLPFAQLSDLCAKLVTHPLWARVPKCGPGYVFYRPLTRLLSVYLRLSQRLPDVSQDVWMAQALSILSRLLPGDEEFALQIVQEILELITPQWAHGRVLNVPQIMWDRGGLAVIAPFLARAVQPRTDVHTAPWYASPNSIQRATTLRLPASSAAFSSRDYGLPLLRDWSLSPLDHLLRSGTSPVFAELPSGWDASEVDVTRAALLLTKIAREVASRFSFVVFVLTREEAVFGCMKVFMLEHGQTHEEATAEVFRDQVVGRFMDDLLAPFTASKATQSESVSGAPLSPVIPSPPTQTQPDLEQVALRFLGPATPFYQYYTDFVALYDAISFAHPTFARLLLPPTSMRYAPDYRRHLWNDFAHVLRSVRTEPMDVLSGDLGEYLWPVDTDAQMLGAYMRALVKDGGAVHGFLRLVATHHVACNIWPDLRDGIGGEQLGEERAEKLLRAVVDQGGLEVVREVSTYRQVRGEGVELPPRCFELSAEVKVSRLEYVRRLGGEAVVQRLEGLLR